MLVRRSLIILKNVHKGGHLCHENESEVGFCIDMGSFLLSWVMAGLEIESEAGFRVDTGDQKRGL